LFPFAGTVRWLAGRSFTLYLMQLPVMQFLRVLSPFSRFSWEGRALITLGTLAVVAVLAEVSERRKSWWRRRFGHLLSRIFPERAPAPPAIQDRTVLR